MKALISNIQRFSLHDGPGIRTTIFFMGCPLRCPWCCNPENLTAEIKHYVDEFGNQKTWGEYYSAEQLKEIILKDKDFYLSDGGVTYSGGECLLQLKNLIPLLKDLKSAGISQCVETSLNVNNEDLATVAPYIDLFYVDLKIATLKEFKEKLNGDLQLVLKNLDYLKPNNAKIIFRIPIVSQMNYTKQNLMAIKDLIKKYCPKDVEVFSVHNLGAYKYQYLKMEYKDFKPSSEHRIALIKEFLKK